MTLDLALIPTARSQDMAPVVPAPDPQVVADLVEAVRARLSPQVHAEESRTGVPVEAARRDEMTEALLAEELEALAGAELAAGRPMPTPAGGGRVGEGGAGPSVWSRGSTAVFGHARRGEH